VGGYLLIAQGAALLGAGFALLQSAPPATGPTSSPATLLLAVGGLCLALAVVVVVNGLNFLQRRPNAWLVALALQGLALGLALLLYWRGHRWQSYPIMAVGIVMVIHLYRNDVTGPLHVNLQAEQSTATRRGVRSPEGGDFHDT
jgi:hypothetical protein